MGWIFDCLELFFDFIDIIVAIALVDTFREILRAYGKPVAGARVKIN
jgi:hypothetical protein